MLCWVKNLLAERKQRVVLNGISFDWTDVTYRMPHGSVLGPVLFLIYGNDLPDVAKLYCKMFADDTKLYQEITGLKDYGDELCRWTTKWLLFFNANKCKFLHIGYNNLKFTIKMTDKNNNTVDRQVVDQEKDLDTIFQEDLKSDQHISYMVNKLKKFLD